MSNYPVLREKVFPEARKRRKVRAVGGLRRLGAQEPYFSLTMESWLNGREDVFGAAHEELVRLWPELKPLAELHLSTRDGVPMHAKANGLYWLAGALGGLGERYHGANGSMGDESPERCLQILAKHLRISLFEAAQVKDGVLLSLASGDTVAQVRERFERYVDEQRPRWKLEADDCIAKLGLVEFGG